MCVYFEMGRKKRPWIFINRFNAIKKKFDETMDEFVRRFNKLYNSLPAEIKPPPVGAKITFAVAFESNFGFTLRERRAPTLDQIQIDSLEIEVNLVAAGKAPETQHSQDKGKEKMESSQSQSLEDMCNIIKTMSNDLNRLELENKNSQRQT